MTSIHRALLALFLSALVSPILLSPTLSAQTLTTRPAKPAAKPAESSSPAAAPAALPTEDTVNSFLFQMFGYEPTITWKIQEIRPSRVPGLAEVTFVLTGPKGPGQNTLLVSSDGKYAINGEVLPFGAKPFEDGRAKLEKGLNGPSKGPAKAPVTIVEFTDLQCPHCKTAAPGIEQLIAQEADERFVFQNFPLPAHNWAAKAAGYVDCLGRASNDAVWKFIQKTFDDQANITEANADEKLKSIVTASGANADEIAACAVQPETKAHIEASVALGKSLDVTGTPTLFINGRKVGGGVPVDVLKKLVDFQTSQDKTDAGVEKSKK